MIDSSLLSHCGCVELVADRGLTFESGIDSHGKQELRLATSNKCRARGLCGRAGRPSFMTREMTVNRNYLLAQQRAQTEPLISTFRIPSTLT
jgi:hypothetical protein